MLSHVWLFVIPWTVARQAPLSMEFSRQEYWIGLPSMRSHRVGHDWSDWALAFIFHKRYINQLGGFRELIINTHSTLGVIQVHMQSSKISESPLCRAQLRSNKVTLDLLFQFPYCKQASFSWSTWCHFFPALLHFWLMISCLKWTLNSAWSCHVPYREISVNNMSPCPTSKVGHEFKVNELTMYIKYVTFQHKHTF